LGSEGLHSVPAGFEIFPHIKEVLLYSVSSKTFYLFLLDTCQSPLKETFNNPADAIDIFPRRAMDWVAFIKCWNAGAPFCRLLLP